MKYKEGTIKEFKTLFKSYSNRKMNESAVMDIMDIVNYEKQFQDNIMLLFDDDLGYPGIVDIAGNGEVYIGMPELKGISSEMFSSNKRLWNDKIRGYNYWIMYFVLHELEHLHQYMEAYGIKSYEDPRVRNIYRKIFDRLNQDDDLVYANYDKYGLEFNHERNANINTAETMYKVVRDSDGEVLARVNHLCYIDTGYKPNKKYIICPLERTYRWMGISDEISGFGLDFKTRFYNGLPITKEEYDFIHQESGYLKDRDYQKIMKYIK